jgi:hypothetical protein
VRLEHDIQGLHALALIQIGLLVVQTAEQSG